MLDLSTDYLIIDDPTNTLLEVKQAEGQWATAVTIPYTQWLAQDEEQASADPLYSVPSRICHIWLLPLTQAYQALIPPVTPPPAPKRGDKLTNSLGEKFLIRKVQTMDWDENGPQRYRLTGTRTPL
jgi:hypothetical protein